MCGLFEELGGECERQYGNVIVTDANTDTQVIRPPWTAPANKFGILELIIVSNQHASAETLIKFFDSELVTSGTPGTTLPPVIGTAAAPLIPWFNLAAGSQLILDKNSCPNIPILGGLSVQTTQQPVHVYAQIVVKSRGGG